VNVSDKIFRVDGTIVQLVLWDLAGQERFKVMRQQFYQGSDGIFLIFDLTNLKSFDRIKEWHQDVQKQLKNKRKIFGFVIGNKSDLFNQRIVSKKIASQLARELRLGYLETSALTGENVEYAFVEIAKLLLKSVKLNK
jgi:small GTP-binding protein